MPLNVQINPNSPNARPTNVGSSEPEYNGQGCASGVGGGSFSCMDTQSYVVSEWSMNGQGMCAANYILKEWGIYYYPDEGQYYNTDFLRGIPTYLVRDPQSEWHITCTDLESILAVSGISYSNAQDRFDEAVSNPQRCAARIDKVKWKAIFDWAEMAVQYKSSQNDIDACIVESFEDVNEEVYNEWKGMIDSGGNLGLSNNQLFGILGGVTALSIVLILKFVK